MYPCEFRLTRFYNRVSAFYLFTSLDSICAYKPSFFFQALPTLFFLSCKILEIGTLQMCSRLLISFFFVVSSLCSCVFLAVFSFTSIFSAVRIEFFQFRSSVSMVKYKDVFINMQIFFVGRELDYNQEQSILHGNFTRLASDPNHLLRSECDIFHILFWLEIYIVKKFISK